MGNHGGFTHESTHNESVEWYTPRSVFDSLACRFDLDPCAPPEESRGLSCVPADKHLTWKDNGLASKWEGRCFVNPPYGMETPAWMRKLAAHGNGIALVFSRTDTAWFQEIAPMASAICFVSGRIRFVKADGSPSSTPGAGSLLIAFGDECKEILFNSRLGFTIDLDPEPGLDFTA